MLGSVSAEASGLIVKFCACATPRARHFPSTSEIDSKVRTLLSLLFAADYVLLSRTLCRFHLELCTTRRTREQGKRTQLVIDAALD